MLNTELTHIETEDEYRKTLADNENVVICCGRMGPMCIPVYAIMKTLETEYPHVAFRDMDFDIPTAHIIHTLPQCSAFMGLPFTIYYKNGEVVAATSSIQTREDMTEILDREFGKK